MKLTIYGCKYILICSVVFVTVYNMSQMGSKISDPIGRMLKEGPNSQVAINYESEHLDELRYVLIYTGQRCGSTFTGELFNHNPDAFYYFEPLHPYHREMPFPRPLDNSKFDKAISDIFQKVFTCEFNDTSGRYLQMNKYKPCLKLFDSYSYTECQSFAHSLCRRYSLRVLKTVRASMEAVILLIKMRNIDLNRLRVIHLLRDPHGQITSYVNISRDTNESIARKAAAICTRNEKDVILREHLQSVFPENFMVVHYEDLADSPLEMADKIYMFIHKKPAPISVKEWISKNTHSDISSPEQRYGTFRKDSNSTANAWKLKLANRSDIAQIIDSACDGFYKASKYYKPYQVNT